MSRPLVTDEVIEGLSFARACVLDQRIASHARKEHSWDEKYADALAALDSITRAHEAAARKVRLSAKKLAKKGIS